MIASALQSPRDKMLLAVFSGRSIRFSCEAVLILYLGQKFLKYLGSEIAEYVIYGVTVIAAVGSIFSIYKWVRVR